MGTNELLGNLPNHSEGLPAMTSILSTWSSNTPSRFLLRKPD